MPGKIGVVTTLIAAALPSRVRGIGFVVSAALRLYRRSR